MGAPATFWFFEITSGIPRPMTLLHFSTVVSLAIRRGGSTGIFGSAVALSQGDRPLNIIGVEHEGLAIAFRHYLQSLQSMGVRFTEPEHVSVPLEQKTIKEPDPNVPIFMDNPFIYAPVGG